MTDDLQRRIQQTYRDIVGPVPLTQRLPELLQELQPEEVMLDESDGESWAYFGLSYASWLVLPRIALQSMSLQWQAQFFALVREMEESLEYPQGYTGQFTVSMRDGSKFVKNVFPHYRHNHLPHRKRSEQ